MRQAYARAGVDPRAVQYVEAHGTGTALGDPIEAKALGAILGEGRTPTDALQIGSVKTNVGHLEAAAGIAGVIKVALSFERNSIPRTLHFRTPNPNIPFEQLGLTVQASPGRWSEDRARLAGVSGFGFGGTNCHVVLEGVTAPTAKRAPTSPRRGERPRVVFVFNGHGGQWRGMAQDLLQAEPAFFEAIVECNDEIAKRTAWSVLETLQRPTMTDAYERVDRVQLLVFAVQVGLARMWRTLGVEPDAVIGHSLGEIAAAHVAGCLTLPEAARVITERATLTMEAASHGGMLATALSAVDAEAMIRTLDIEPRSLVIGAMNGPTSTVLSGDERALKAAIERLESEQVRWARVAIGYASHSEQMHPLADRLERALVGLAPTPPSITMYSTVSDDDHPLTDATYWADNLRRPVRFSDALQRMLDHAPTAVIEIGGHPVLSRIVEQASTDRNVSITVQPSLRRNESSCHVLDETCAALEVAGVEISDHRNQNCTVVSLTAKNDDALQAQAAAIHRIMSTDGTSAPDVAYTCARVRGSHDHRLAIVGAGPAMIVQGLEAIANGQRRRGVVTGQVDPNRTPRVAFVFGGSGASIDRVGLALAKSEPVFGEAMRRCDAAIRREGGPCVLDALSGDGPLLDVATAQPTLFAIQVSLARLYEHWGVEPEAVVGHSVGEVAAAHVAGALSLSDAARVVAVRSRLLGTLDGGAMATVGLSLEATQTKIAQRGGGVSVAVSNSHEYTVVCGPESAIDALIDDLAEQDVFARRLAVQAAGHGPQVESLKTSLLDALIDIEPKPTPTLWSTVTGRTIDGESVTAAYWYENLRRPVRFAETLDRMCQSGLTAFVELAAHPLLLPTADSLLRPHAHEDRAPAWVSTLRNGQDERTCVLEALATLYVRGCPIDWTRVLPRGRTVNLGPYPWQRVRHWLESRPAATERQGWFTADISSSLRPNARLFHADITTEERPYLADHRVANVVTLPAAAVIDMALAAAHAVHPTGNHALVDLALVAPVVLHADGPTHIELIVSDSQDGYGFELLSHRDDLVGARDKHARPFGWTTHAASVMRVDATLPNGEQVERIRERCIERVDAEEHYNILERRGVVYGPAFRGVDAIWHNREEALAQVTLRTRPSLARIHPALVDACLQAAAPLIDDEGACPWVAAAVDEVVVTSRLTTRAWSHVRIRNRDQLDAGEVVVDVRIYDEGGATIAALTGLRLSRLRPTSTDRDAFFDIEWVSRPRTSSAHLETKHATGSQHAAGRWAVLAPEADCAQAIAAGLGARGAEVTVAKSSRPILDMRDDWRAIVVALGPARTTPEGRLALERWLFDVTTQLVARIPSASGAPRLYIITERGAPIRNTNCNPWQWSANGLAEVIRHEHPQLRCTTVDVEDAFDVDTLVEELTSDDSETQVVLRAERLVPRLTPFAPRQIRSPICPSVTYVIVGGLGGVGLATAKWLVDGGATSLLLVGRQGANTDAKAASVEALRATGVRIEVLAADAAVATEAQRIIDEPNVRSMPPIRGVVHAAAVLDDGLLAEQTSERMRAVMAAKVDGAWNLHLATRDLPLDWFVLYSSMTAVVGAPGIGAYAAANAFVDGLAGMRRSEGLVALAVRWGAFEDAGIALRQRHAAHILERGMGNMRVAEGLERLGSVLGGERSEVIISPFDVATWRTSCPATADRPLFEGLDAETKPTASPLDSIDRASSADRVRLMEEHVASQLAFVLRAEPTSIDRRAPLATLGVDSMLALELRNRLGADLGRLLPATLIWKFPTVRAIAAHLVEVRWPTGAVVAAPDPAQSDLHSLSRTDKETLLDDMLDELEDALE